MRETLTYLSHLDNDDTKKKVCNYKSWISFVSKGDNYV